MKEIQNISIISSKNMTYKGSSKLCESASDSGRERCSTPSETTVSEFYVKIHSYRSHPSGTLTFVGSNLISATNANQTEEAMSEVDQRCEQIGLFDKIDDLKSAIEESQLDSEGMISKFDSHIDFLLFKTYYNVIFEIDILLVNFSN